MSSSRQLVRGVVITPELGRIVNGKEHVATRYIVYGDRARGIVLSDVELDGVKKNSYTYYNDFLYDDQILFFTTNMKFSDNTWSGESPLTRVVLRKEQVSSSGIIVTPNISVDIMNDADVRISVSEFIRYDGLAGHDSTSYLVEDDITGDVIYEIPNSRDFLYGINIPRGLLKSGRVYRISARFKDMVGKYSNYGSLIYTYNNILDKIVDGNVINVNYGSKTILENIELNIVLSNELRITIYEDDVIVGHPIYRKGNILFDTSVLDIGSKLTCDFDYGIYSKTFDLFINKPNVKVLKNDNFKFNYITSPATILGSINIENKNLQIFKGNYVYRVLGNSIVRGIYDTTLDTININTVLGYYSELSTGNDYKYRIFENPINGDVVIYESRYGVGVLDYIYVLDKYTDNIIKVLDIPTMKEEFLDTGDLILLDNKLHLFRTNDSDNYIKEWYSVSMLDYNIQLEGNVIFDVNIDTTLYRPILLKNSIYFISKKLTNTSIFKLNHNNLSLEIVNNITSTISLAGYMNNMYIKTLNTDLVTIMIPNYLNRAKVGYLKLDILSGVIEEHLYNTNNTNSLTNIITDNNGVFLFHDGINCQKFN